MDNVILFAQGIEAGRYVNRDLCASDQERTTPIKIAEYIDKYFTDTKVVSHTTEPIEFGKYPTMHAVNRVNQGSSDISHRRSRKNHKNWLTSWLISILIWQTKSLIELDTAR